MENSKRKLNKAPKQVPKLLINFKKKQQNGKFKHTLF